MYFKGDKNMSPDDIASLTWSTLGPGKENLLKLQKYFQANEINLKILKKHETMEPEFENNFDVLLIVGPKWPKDILIKPLFIVWLCTGKLSDQSPSQNLSDFGMDFESFCKNPKWYINQIQKMAHLKIHGNTSRQWKDSIIEKLKTKSETLEKMNSRLQKLSITDDLTGSYNHRFFRQLFSDEMDRAHRYEFPLSILMADIDHFKSVNDNYGHLVGDKILIAVSNELKACVRRVDTVCRYGGEEFTIILPMTGPKPAKELAERIRKRIQYLYPQKGIPLEKLSISIGVATYPEHGNTTESLLEAADQALYEAKAKGRNQVALPRDLQVYD